MLSPEIQSAFRKASDESFLRRIGQVWSDYEKPGIDRLIKYNKKEINKIGEFPLSINLHSDLVAELHVLVEKPMVEKLSQLEQLKEISQNH